MQFTGTDWPGKGNDFVDIKAVVLSPVPEPEDYTMLLAGLACVALAIRRRRRSVIAASTYLNVNVSEPPRE